MSASATITLTDRAANEIKRVLAEKKADAGTTGLRVAIKGGGCSGFSYFLDLENQPRDFDEKLESHGIPIYCDKKSLLFVSGTVIDYDRTRLSGGFTFENPNAKGTCGCGTSFQV